jgi:uncharacterized membrane protein YcaP (DUF421 family)
MRSLTLAGLFAPELPPWEVALRAAFVYVFIQVLFRALGRKELGRWGLPDVVLLFLLGTAVRTSIVGKDASLTSAMVGLSTIALLDWLLSRASARSDRVADLLEGPVRQLVRDGEILDRQLRRVRLSRSELLAHVHEKGGESLSDVKHAFLERSGKVTVVLR